MGTLDTVCSVVAGVVVTLVLGAVTLGALPILGFATARSVGTGLPTWVFALPLVLAVGLGGATTGYVLNGTRVRSGLLGGLAAGLGVLVVGVLVGLAVFVFALKLIPTGGQPIDYQGGILTFSALGGGLGFLSGGVVGGVGGVVGRACRRRFSR
jgi:hypothetical protein